MQNTKEYKIHLGVLTRSTCVFKGSKRSPLFMLPCKCLPSLTVWALYLLLSYNEIYSPTVSCLRGVNAARVMLNDSMRRLPLPSGEDICTTWWSFLSEYQSSNWAQAGKTWVAHKGSEGPPSLHPSMLPFFLPLSTHIALPKCMSSFVPPPDTHFHFLHFSS